MRELNMRSRLVRLERISSSCNSTNVSPNRTGDGGPFAPPGRELHFSLAPFLITRYIPNHDGCETTSPATAAARRKAAGGRTQAEGAETTRLPQGESAVRQATAPPCDVEGGQRRLESAQRAELSPLEGLPRSGSGKIRAAGDRLQHPGQPL